MQDELTLVAAVRRSPVRMALFVGLPLVLGAVQLVNGLVTDLALWVSVAFAAAMVSYAVVYVRFHLAQQRLAMLESGPSRPTAD